MIPAFHSEAEIGDCLEALRNQTYRAFETIVVDSGPGHAAARRVASDSSEARIVRVPRPLPPHAARNRGAALARGDILVFTDPDCRPDPGWLAALVAAHRAGHSVVGGAIEPADRRWFDRGVHHVKFGPWLGGAEPGRRSALPSANLSWRRDAWTAVGPFRVLGWSGDTDLCWRARAAGFPLRFEPAAMVRHHQRIGVASFVRERFERGRAFAELRSTRSGWSRAHRLARIALCPLVPFLLTARAISSTARGRRCPTLLLLPALLVGYSAWALGEASAYGASLGSGRSNRGVGR